MQDRETDTWWSHVLGTAIRGELEGTELEIVPSVQTTWSKWSTAHPETKVLRKDREVTSSRYEDYFADPERTGLFRSSWLMERMPGKEMVYGVAKGPHAAAVRSSALEESGAALVDLGGTPVVVARGEDGGVRAWVARVAGAGLELTPGESAWTDSAGRAWDLNEGVHHGPEGTTLRLEAVPVTEAFWFAWSSFYPNTKVVEGSSEDASVE